MDPFAFTDDPDAALPTIVRPAWCDPTFVLSANEHQLVSMVIPAGVITQILPNDPTRWCVRFLLPPTGASICFVAPHVRPDSMGFALANTVQTLRISAFDDGPVVCHEWYAYSALGTVLSAWVETIQG